MPVGQLQKRQKNSRAQIALMVTANSSEDGAGRSELLDVGEVRLSRAPGGSCVSSELQSILVQDVNRHPSPSDLGL